MKNILFAGLGGFLGASLRYIVSLLTERFVPKEVFPAATLSVNLIGCFIIGFLFEIVDTKWLISDSTKLFLFVGILGSFTTFSTFGLDSINLIKSGEHFNMILYVMSHIILGFLFVVLGAYAAKVAWN